jgi:hypothetical protein
MSLLDWIPLCIRLPLYGAFLFAAVPALVAYWWTRGAALARRHELAAERAGVDA